MALKLVMQMAAGTAPRSLGASAIAGHCSPPYVHCLLCFCTCFPLLPILLAIRTVMTVIDSVAQGQAEAARLLGTPDATTQDAAQDTGAGAGSGTGAAVLSAHDGDGDGNGNGEARAAKKPRTDSGVKVAWLLSFLN